MKTVFFARHAKSNWGEAGVSDFERPINSQGEIDAPAMADFFAANHVMPQQIISSDARRALQTANAYKRQLTPNAEVIKDARLYNASPTDIAQIITQQSDVLSSIMLVGHNPGMTEIINFYVHSSGVLDMPSCGVAIVKFEIKSWRDVKSASGELMAFEYPGKLG